MASFLRKSKLEINLKMFTILGLGEKLYWRITYNLPLISGSCCVIIIYNIALN